MKVFFLLQKKFKQSLIIKPHDFQFLLHTQHSSFRTLFIFPRPFLIFPTLFLFIFLLNSMHVFCQKKPSYPLPKEVLVSKCPVGKSGGSLIVTSISDPKTFNPIIENESSSSDIIGRMLDGLVGFNNKTQEVEPGLAKSWKPSANGLEWVFHLRKGVLWSDGKPFTADDVIFSFDLTYDSKIHSAMGDLLKIDGKPFKYEKIDAYTVKITTPDIYAPFIDYIGGVAMIPKHKLEESYKKGDFETQYGLSTKPEDIIVTGPFVLEKYIPSQKVVLKRNPYYWKVDKKKQRLPYLDKIVFLIVPDQNVDLLKFQSGESDYLAIRPEDYQILKSEEKKGGYKIYNLGTTLNKQFVWFNLNPEKNSKNNEPYVIPYKLKWFNNMKFRQAIAHAVDQQSVINLCFLGLGVNSWGYVSPANKKWFNPKIKKYPYNLKKAKKLLSEIGMIDRNGDGYIEDKEGHVIEFTMLTNTGNTIRGQIGNILKEDFKKIGIKCNFTPIDFNMFVNKISKTFDYECGLLGLGGGGLDPTSSMNVLLSSGFTHQWYPNQKKPSAKWEAEIDKLMYDQLKTLDFKKRKKYFDRVQEIMSEQLPYIYLPNRSILLVIRNKIGNANLTVLEHNFLWNCDELFIK